MVLLSYPSSDENKSVTNVMQNSAVNVNNEQN